MRRVQIRRRPADMSYLFKNGTLVSFSPATIEHADLRISGARIVERGPQLEPHDNDEVIDLGGRVVMPGMVCAHTHLYSALSRGMPEPPQAPANFKETLELIWWRLDCALDEEAIYWSALVGALDAARAGTTCLFDHHSSPSYIWGSLQIVREAVERVGLRSVLCYEITDRNGRKCRDEAIEESRAFLEWIERAPSPLFRGMVGAHASFTLSDDSLAACAELMQRFGVGLHIHVAEDVCDLEDTQAKYGMSIVERLTKYGALNERTILAHATHLDRQSLEIARSSGVWFAHNPRSNMNNRVGYAPVVELGERLVLGTDGIGADMFEEARFAFFKAREARSGLGADRWMSVLANNQQMASNAFGVQLGTLQKDAVADLIVLDYFAPTPLTAENLAWHLVFGVSSAYLDSVMVGGRFIIRGKHPLLDEVGLYEQARRVSKRLWNKLQKL
jgi:putative selenium metabolism protein SsnA